MSFNVGDEVVCVDDDRFGLIFGESHPVKGHHYTIREIEYCEGDFYPFPAWGVILKEIVNAPREYSDGFGECNFRADRFRLVKRETIEVFRAMCVSPKPLVPVE